MKMFPVNRESSRLKKKKDRPSGRGKLTICTLGADFAPKISLPSDTQLLAALQKPAA